MGSCKNILGSGSKNFGGGWVIKKFGGGWQIPFWGGVAKTLLVGDEKFGGWSSKYVLRVGWQKIWRVGWEKFAWVGVTKWFLWGRMTKKETRDDESPKWNVAKTLAAPFGELWSTVINFHQWQDPEMKYTKLFNRDKREVPLQMYNHTKCSASANKSYVSW